jgi:hypothetical protein
MKNISKDEKYLKYREQELAYLQDKYKTEEIEVHFSSNNEFMLTVEHFEFIEGNVRHNSTRGVITNNTQNYKIEINRNFGIFPFEWVTVGSNQYLLCAQDYQGYTIVNLESKEIKDFVPEDYFDGMGFCWANIHFTSGINILVVEGCYWAHEYEIIFYDFSNPEQLPYREIKRVSPYEKVIGWKDRGYFQYDNELVKIF